MDRPIEASREASPGAGPAGVAADPAFQALVQERGRLGLATVLLTMAVYFGYLALLAFAPALMRSRVSGVITASFPIGIAVMIFTVAIVGFYVWRASTRFERMTADIVRRHRA